MSDPQHTNPTPRKSGSFVHTPLSQTVSAQTHVILSSGSFSKTLPPAQMKVGESVCPQAREPDFDPNR